MKYRVGEISYNKYGSLMKIIEYRNSDDIDIIFPNYNYIVFNKQYHNFKNGNIKCPYDKTILNIGYIGDGNYKTTNGLVGKLKDNSIQYKYWYSMLRRCFDEKFKINHKSYKDCTVDEEWHNFQNFAKWFDENYYEIDNERMHLDKDILIKENKIYSPETCIFVPQRINDLFVKCDKSRGEYPIGVIKTKNNKFYSYVNVIKRVHLGSYKTPEDAFNAYKTFKENYIKQVADDYKDKIPKKLYDAMYKYEVEITD